jgi:hypothetical protein
VVLVAALLPIAACSSLGPSKMRASRMMYNEAVQQTEQRELLLNLVRLRYTESPEFLAINSISTQFSFEASAAIAAEVGGQDGSLLFPGGVVGYSERPTLTFSPQRGREFTSLLLQPIDLDTLQLLVHYGWGLDRVLRLTVQRLNELDNRTTREEPTPGYADELADFAGVAELMGALHRQGRLEIGLSGDFERVAGPLAADHLQADDLLGLTEAGYRLEYLDEEQSYVLLRPSRHFVLRFAERTEENTEAAEITRRLGLAPGRSSYGVESRIGPKSGRGAPANGSSVLHVQTQSVLGTMAYLSRAVTVPEGHLAAGLAAPSDGRGTPGTVLSDLLEVHVDSSRPDARLAVPYRGYWFFIEDSDQESRRTLGLLNFLFRLNVTGGGAQDAPVLTLPVGR